MFFKLAYQNVIKSIKDYTIYFMTLAFGVCLFYVFNSLKSQQALLTLSESQMSIMKVTTEIISGISVLVSFILGFLIIYANQFLIKRRKKELGIYMVLGMEKGKISRIFIAETTIIGLFSLVTGLIVGVFAAQGMAILSAKLFVVKMKEFRFVFSPETIGKTIFYFLIIYIVVMIFNTLSISRFKLIDLLMAARKNETLKVKKLSTSLILFIISIGCLGVAYSLILKNGLITFSTDFKISILLGVIGTFLFFLSLSGFALRMVRANKKIYYKGLNMFVLRQVNSKITTTFVSMSFICLMLFITIGILSSGAGLTNTMNQMIKKGTPFDMSIISTMGEELNPEIAQYSLVERMKADGVWTEDLKEKYAEGVLYNIQGLTYEQVLAEMKPSDVVSEKMVKEIQKSPLQVMSISNYNAMMELAGREKIQLGKDQVALSTTMKESMEIYKKLLTSKKTSIQINGDKYSLIGPIQTETYYTYTMDHDRGTLIVPDHLVEGQTIINRILNINLATTNKEKIEELTNKYLEYGKQTGLFSVCASRMQLEEEQAGLGMMLSYIAIYIGLVFLVTCATILALQQLSESSDNQKRYELLRKIGAEDKEINQSIFKQVAISFLVPLFLAIIHSIVGLTVVNKMISYMGYSQAMVGITAAAVGIILIYGGYMIATYVGCKVMIKKGY